MYGSTIVLEYGPKIMTDPILSSTRNDYINNDSFFFLSTYHMPGTVLPP